MFGLCFDKRVLGGIAIVGIGVLIVAPKLIGVMLPLLLIAACPLSMLLMGRAMKGRSDASPTAAMASPGRPVPIDVPYRTGAADDPTTQTALLRQELRDLAERQAALAQQIAELEAPQTPPAQAGPGSLDRMATG